MSHAVSASYVSVVLIERERLVLEALTSAPSELDRIRFVGVAHSVDDGLALFERTAPDVLLLDGACFWDGFRAVSSQLRIRLSECKLGVFADRLSDSQVEVALAARTTGLFSRQDSLKDLMSGLQGIARGEVRISMNLQHRIVRDSQTGKLVVERRRNIASLSLRQMELLVQLAIGRRVKDIATALEISEKAVESQKYRIMNQLGIHDRVELCLWAIREGLIDATESAGRRIPCYHTGGQEPSGEVDPMI